MPSPTDFSCDRCDFKASNLVVWGRFYYQNFDGNLIPLKRNLGWCSSCKTLSAVENLSIDKTIYDKINEYEAELNKLKNPVFFIKHLMGSKKKEEIKDRIAYAQQFIKEEIELVNILRSRKTPPRCLRCSSSDVIQYKFPSAGFDESPNKLFPTGFIHPGCGGNIIMSNSGIDFMMRRKSRAYTTDGILIKEWYE